MIKVVEGELYIFGVRISKKLLTVAVSMLALYLKDYIGLNEEVVKWIAGLAMTYVGGQSLVDAVNSKNDSTPA